MSRAPSVSRAFERILKLQFCRQVLTDCPEGGTYCLDGERTLGHEINETTPDSWFLAAILAPARQQFLGSRPGVSRRHRASATRGKHAVGSMGHEVAKALVAANLELDRVVG